MLQLTQAWNPSSLVGEVGIQLGMSRNESQLFTVPSGKSFLFFNNIGDDDFILTVYGLSQTNYLIQSSRSGVITFESFEPRWVRLDISCPSKRCQGLAMMASCSL